MAKTNGPKSETGISQGRTISEIAISCRSVAAAAHTMASDTFSKIEALRKKGV
jgi:hypothetical protein